MSGVLQNPDRIDMHFQPIIDLRRGVACGYEMLARFPGADGLGPDSWFAAARNLGVSAELEGILVTKGLGVRDTLPPNCFLTINVGPEDLASTEVQTAIARGGDLDAVVFELTEHTTIPDAAIEDALAPIRKHGGLVALDDVGAGYSGLSRMNRLRPDFLKIDRQLVAGIDQDPAKLEMIESLGAVANRIDAWITVEGIETLAELDSMISLDVPLAQGFGLGRPSSTMARLDPTIADHIHDSQLFRVQHQEFAGMIVPVEPHTDSHGDERIEARFIEKSDLKHVPIIDPRERPVSLASRGDGTGSIVLSKPLLISSASRFAQIARRAMTRPERNRFDPLVFCDEMGRYVGLVSMESLIEALAETSS